MSDYDKVSFSAFKLPAEHFVGMIPSHAHQKTKDLFEYWTSLHGRGGLPGRRHFDPVHIPLLLPNIFLADVSSSNEFVFRLVGTRLDEFFYSVRLLNSEKKMFSQ